MFDSSIDYEPILSAAYRKLGDRDADRKAKYANRKIHSLQALIQLMDPAGEFVQFWATLREFCQKTFQGQLPAQRALSMFFSYHFDDATTAILHNLNKTSSFINRLNIVSQVISSSSTTPTSTPTSTITSNQQDLISWFLIQANLPTTTSNGASTLDNHGWSRGSGSGSGSRGSGSYSRDDDGSSDVVELFAYLADWSTASVNQRCPCSQIQTLIVTGIAPDGTVHNEIPLKYNVGRPNKNFPDYSVQFVNIHDQLCSSRYPGVCLPRPLGDTADISGDSLLGSITQAQISSAILAEVSVLEDVLGDFYEPEH